MAAVKVDPKRVREFRDEASFDAWLGKNWNAEPEVWIKMHKRASGLPSIAHTEAIDVALCWGWIDGIRKGFDEKSFLQRFCPRGKKSTWSRINVDNVQRLIAAKRMRPSGLVHVESAKADGRWSKAYRAATDTVPEDLARAIAKSAKARATFATLTAQNRFALVFRVSSLKTEEARARKIATFVAMLERGETIHPQGPKSDRKPAKKATAKSPAKKRA
ncbi:MAG: YdeI/OmpD-associated family protein [Polyangiaceae bacterium]